MFGKFWILCFSGSKKYYKRESTDGVNVATEEVVTDVNNEEDWGDDEDWWFILSRKLKIKR